MNDYIVISLRERPDLKNRAAAWFHSKWNVPEHAYLDAMEAYLSQQSDLGWYLCSAGDVIVGGIGVTSSDFHVRTDLTPNLCALYVEENYRHRGIAGKLLTMALHDLVSLGISPVYLLTDHSGFYEKHGWDFLCMVQASDSTISRMYIHR